jgi:RNA polymerase primary sigma factor
MRAMNVKEVVAGRRDTLFNNYINDIARCETTPLSREDEAILFAKARAGDALAYKRIVEANYLFVVSIARKYTAKNLTTTDLINEGNIGLLQAINKFNPARGFKFITYAVWWIREAIQTAIREHDNQVRVPEQRLRLHSKVVSATDYLTSVLQRHPLDSEIADWLGLSEENVQSVRFDARHIYDPTSPPSDSDEDSMFRELPDNTFDAPDLVAGELQQEQRDRILRGLSKLTNTEATLIRLVFGLNGTTLTIRETADAMGIKLVTAFDIQSRALRKLHSDIKRF